MEATKKLLWGLLLGSAFAVSCPDNTSSCALNCSTTCSGTVNCSTNAECSVNCNGNRACSGLKVDGLYQIDPSKYVSTCAGSYDCQNAVLTARAANSTKFLCSGTYGCTGATINCPSNNCALVCNGGSTSCRDMASFNCLGGEGGTCDIQCNGGCYGPLSVTCTNYPCTVTVSGNQTTISGGFAPPCPAGQKLCTGGICVNSTVTVCPSRCEINDPCKTAQGNECMDVGVAGGPYNCTCDAANFKDGVMSGGLVTTCQLVQTTSNTTNTTNTTNTNTTTTNITKPDTPEVEGNSLILKTYSNDQCTGTPTSTKTFPKGCGNGLPNPGQFSNSRCTNLHYCISTGTGTCGGINFNCIPDQETGVCKNGQMYVCDNSGVAQLTVGFALVIATIAALF